jgi:hypothetical protein
MASEEVAEQALENLFNDKLGSANQKIGGATLVPFKWRRQFSGGISGTSHAVGTELA